ncbi:MAG: restriction endonuclease subunit S [Deltaproteobacteria bacterium]|nr:restriction endonuclease subunit S [Deltaproteobacteria bacterium]MBW2165154.1 restriction endonuclease subunit S [Deltaproteobacteria bacterium]
MILVKKGDLVISGINVEKGALSVYEEDEDALATIHYSSYEYDKNQVDIEYLKWFLKSRTFQNIVKEQAGGGIKTELKAKKFLPLKIKLPGLDAQIDIARKIDNVAAEINDLSETNNHNQTLLIQLRQTILQEAVQGKLVPQDTNDEPAGELLKRIEAEKEKLITEGKIKKQNPLPPIAEDEVPYKLPQGWEWTNIQNISYQVTDGEHATPARIDIKEIPLATAKNVRDGYLDITVTDFVSNKTAKKCWNRCKPQHNDILMVCVGATTGRLCVIKNPPDIVLVRSVALIRPMSPYIQSEYLSIVLKSSLGQSQIWGNVKQSAQPCLYLNKINRINIPCPCTNEQKRIVAKVDQLMNLCDDLETRLNQSKKDSEMLMQAVLHEAFS